MLVAYILYAFYMKIKGSAAMSIFFGLFTLFGVWLLVKALNMSLMSAIMNRITGVGIIAFVVVFQQEIRKFLLSLGNKYSFKQLFSLDNLIGKFVKKDPLQLNIPEIVKACTVFAANNVGALIVLPYHSDLSSIIATGEKLDCNISARILDAIFFKNAPLHDGAVIIINGRIAAAKCVLPVSENMNLPKKIGLRHRSGIGISESTDSLVIIVSEERGEISYAEYGGIVTGITPEQLSDKLKERFVLGQNNFKFLAEEKIGDILAFLKK